MSLSRRSLRLLTLLVVSSAPALAQDGSSAGSASATESATADEIESFKATAGRFTNRMREFEDDAREIIQRREEQDKTQLWDSYNALLTELNEDERRLRETAVSRFEAFLTKYPSSPESASIKFRLAELEFEKSEEDWYIADQEYNRFMDTLDPETDFDSIPDVPKKDYSRSMTLYESIVDEHRDYEFIDGAYYMLGYCTSDPNAAQYDENASLGFFQQLIDTAPDSQFASAAHLRIGEYYFDYNQIDQAIPHYQSVVEIEGEGGNLYDEGLYKLAWSHYKKSEYDRALDLMTQLLDYSEQQFMDTGKRSSMGKEAIEYSAISFSDVGDRMGERPVDVARDYYARVGDKPFEKTVYERLADVLIQQARYEDAIDTYAFMQERWPNDPKNPDYQWQIALLYNSLPVPDTVAAQNTITQLNDRYNDQSPWWQANRDNPEALAQAREYIEKSLSTVAAGQHSKAIASGDPNDFREAAILYQRYLTEFPFADDYYDIQWYLSDTLVNAGDLDGAEAQYTQLLKSGRDHNYREMSLYRLSLVRRQQIIDALGSPVERPDDAPLLRTEPLVGGQGEREVYSLNELHDDYINTFDELNAIDLDERIGEIEQQVAATEEPKARERYQAQRDELIRYQEGIEKNRPALSYEIGQIYYNHGQLIEARERFFELIDQYPERIEAAYAAKLVIDSFNDENDLASVREYASIYATNPLGPIGADVSDLDFENIERQAAFLQAQELTTQAAKSRRAGDMSAARDQRLQAADAFLAYTRDYPEEDDIFRKAFYNIGQNYAEAGEVDKANTYFREYVDRFPTDELSFPLTFRIASNYAGILELDKAVSYFEQLYRNAGKDYADADIALYNAAFLRIGMGDFKGAAEGFERYARDFSENPDAEQVMFQAGQQWEEVGDAEALKFYRRYLSRFGNSDADHTMEAYQRIADITEKSGGRQREIDRAWDDLSQAYQSLAEKVGPAGRHYAAHAAFRDLEKQFEAFKVIRYTRNDQKNAELLINQKPEELAALNQAALDLVSTYKDFEYTSAALYIAGMGYLTYSDMIYEAPVPPEIERDEELLMLYQEKLDELRIPVEDKARARLEANLQKGKEAKRWSPYLTKTLEALSGRFPGDFAAEKGEIRGEAEASFVARPRPISVRDPEVVEPDPEPIQDGPAEPSPESPSPPEPTPEPTPDPGPWQE
ncbi:MAG: tetratricopeptide repeat protein [Myxococcota bacterium]